MEIRPVNITKFNHSIKRKPTMVWYYATWCGHCITFEPTWNKFVKICKSKYPKLNLVKIESQVIPKLNFEPNVNGYPTVKFYNKKLDATDNDFEGERSTKGLMNFIKDNSVKHALNLLASKKKSLKAKNSATRPRRVSGKKKKKRSIKK